MPMMYTYSCPQCGAETGPVNGLPNTWFSVNIPGTENSPSQTEYFDSWNCLSVYASESAPAE